MSYTGKDAGGEFVKEIRKVGYSLTQKIKKANAPMKFGENEKQ